MKHDISNTSHANYNEQVTFKQIATPTGLIVLLTLVYALSSTTLPTGQADADELTTAAYFNSVAHPPGFPLFISVSHLAFKLMPFFTIAQRANYLGSFYQASATIILFYLISLILKKQYPKEKGISTTLAAATATGLLAFSYQWWLYGTIFEIYSFTSLLTATTLLFAFRWYYGGKLATGRDFWLTWIMTGLLIGHIPLALLLLPGLGILFLQKMTARKIKMSSLSLIIGKGVICGIAAFILSNSLLFIQNQPSSKSFSWGMAPSLQGWWNHITRKDYTGFDPERNAQFNAVETKSALINGGTITSITQYIQMLINHFGTIAILLFVIGVWHTWKTDKKIAVVISFFFGMSGIFLAGYMRLSEIGFQKTLYTGIGERQFALSIGIIAIFIAFGINAIYLWFSKRQNHPWILITLSLVIVGLQIYANQSISTNKSDRTIAYTYAKERLNSVPSNALIICSNDSDCYSLFYLQEIEKTRPDVIVLPHILAYKLNLIMHDKQLYPYQEYSLPDYFPQLLAWNARMRPVYLTSSINYYVDYLGLESGPFYLEPIGQLFKVTIDIPTTISATPLPQYITKTHIDSRNKYTTGIINTIANTRAYAAYLSLRYQQPEVAKQFLSQSLQLDSTNRQTYQIQEQQQNIATSMKVIKDKQNVADYLKAGMAAEKEQKITHAEFLYRQATYLDPTSIPALTSLRDFYAKYKATEQASEIGQHLGIMSSGTPK